MSLDQEHYEIDDEYSCDLVLVGDGFVGGVGSFVEPGAAVAREACAGRSGIVMDIDSMAEVSSLLSCIGLQATDSIFDDAEGTLVGFGSDGGIHSGEVDYKGDSKTSCCDDVGPVAAIADDVTVSVSGICVQPGAAGVEVVTVGGSSISKVSGSMAASGDYSMFSCIELQAARKLNLNQSKQSAKLNKHANISMCGGCVEASVSKGAGKIDDSVCKCSVNKGSEVSSAGGEDTVSKGGGKKSCGVPGGGAVASVSKGGGKNISAVPFGGGDVGSACSDGGECSKADGNNIYTVKNEYVSVEIKSTQQELASLDLEAESAVRDHINSKGHQLVYMVQPTLRWQNSNPNKPSSEHRIPNTNTWMRVSD